MLSWSNGAPRIISSTHQEQVQNGFLVEFTALVDALYNYAQVPKYHTHLREPRQKISNNMAQKTETINLWQTRQNFFYIYC